MSWWLKFSHPIWDVLRETACQKFESHLAAAAKSPFHTHSMSLLYAETVPHQKKIKRASTQRCLSSKLRAGMCGPDLGAAEPHSSWPARVPAKKKNKRVTTGKSLIVIAPQKFRGQHMIFSPGWVVLNEECYVVKLWDSTWTERKVLTDTGAKGKCLAWRLSTLSTLKIKYAHWWCRDIATIFGFGIPAGLQNPFVHL